MQARIREGAARVAMPNSKAEGEAERRMRELYEERLQEYGELAAVEEKEEDERCCTFFYVLLDWITSICTHPSTEQSYEMANYTVVTYPQTPKSRPPTGVELRTDWS